MNIADPKFLEHLRDLPSGYLLDMLADDEEGDRESIIWVLQERGFSREEIDQSWKRRRSSFLPRPYRIWAIARWLSLCNALIICYFNISGLYRLMQSEHTFKGPLLFLATGCILCGFVVGYKLTSHIYHGGKKHLYCGFPVPVGVVDLQTGEEVPGSSSALVLRIAVNALVGVSMTLFPLVFIYIMME
jgi:hypothetical protein